LSLQKGLEWAIRWTNFSQGSCLQVCPSTLEAAVKVDDGVPDELTKEKQRKRVRIGLESKEKRHKRHMKVNHAIFLYGGIMVCFMVGMVMGTVMSFSMVPASPKPPMKTPMQWSRVMGSYDGMHHDYVTHPRLWKVAMKRFRRIKVHFGKRFTWVNHTIPPYYSN